MTTCSTWSIAGAIVTNNSLFKSDVGSVGLVLRHITFADSLITLQIEDAENIKKLVNVSCDVFMFPMDDVYRYSNVSEINKVILSLVFQCLRLSLLPTAPPFGPPKDLGISIEDVFHFLFLQQLVFLDIWLN